MKYQKKIPRKKHKLKNEEYLSYVDYLKSINFNEKLEILKNKYADKKIVLFGIGLLLDAVIDNYNISECLNIVGISDKRVVEDKDFGYKNYNVYSPRALRALNFDVILDTSVLFDDTKSYLRKNYLVKKAVKIDNIIQISACERVKSFFDKINSVVNYAITTGNIFRALKYIFVCSASELKVKTNYIKIFRKLKKSDKPIRTVFICSDVVNADFMGLYNLIYFDKDFKLFPIILTPDLLLDTEEINEEKMQKNIEYFNSYNVQVIDGVDRESREIPSLHAFKPDLIFYQKPIYIKDDYCPAKMSKQALTFTVEYLSDKSDFTAMGSKYYRKQAANLWKVFVDNSQDKNLYSEYTDTKNKDLVTVVNGNINTGVMKFLKKCLKRN